MYIHTSDHDCLINSTFNVPAKNAAATVKAPHILMQDAVKL